MRLLCIACEFLRQPTSSISNLKWAWSQIIGSEKLHSSCAWWVTKALLQFQTAPKFLSLACDEFRTTLHTNEVSRLDTSFMCKVVRNSSQFNGSGMQPVTGIFVNCVFSPAHYSTGLSIEAESSLTKLNFKRKELIDSSWKFKWLNSTWRKFAFQVESNRRLASLFYISTSNTSFLAVSSPTKHFTKINGRTKTTWPIKWTFLK